MSLVQSCMCFVPFFSFSAPLSAERFVKLSIYSELQHIKWKVHRRATTERVCAVRARRMRRVGENRNVHTCSYSILRWIGAKQSHLPRRTRRENGCFDVDGVFPWPVLVPQRLSPRLACCYIDTTPNDTESIPVRTKIETDADGGRIEIPPRKTALGRFIRWKRARIRHFCDSVNASAATTFLLFSISSPNEKSFNDSFDWSRGRLTRETSNRY